MNLDLIVGALAEHRQRATYGAVAGLVGGLPHTVLGGRKRNAKHSWVVNAETGQPSGYKAGEVDPQLSVNNHVITSSQGLAEWLSEKGFAVDHPHGDPPVPAVDLDLSPYAELTGRQLLAAYAGIMRSLRDRGLVRSSNNPVADLAERLASIAFSLELAGRSAKGYDGISKDGKRWQVKGRRHTPENDSTQLGVVRAIDANHFDYLVAIYFREDFSVHKAYRIDHGAIGDHARFGKAQNGHLITLTATLLSDTRCVDVTTTVRAAEEALHTELADHASGVHKQAPRPPAPAAAKTKADRSAALPDASHSLLVSRTTAGPVGHEWTGNEDDAGQYHGLLDVNEVPCLLALYWNSRSAGRTVHVGTYKLNLRRLAKEGFATMKAGNKVRLRFVRDAGGTIEIRPNDSSPGLAVGRAEF